MRELTSIEISAIGAGVDPQPSLQSEFWSSFMYSSGFASGIFWSPVMPLIMGSVAIMTIVGSGLVSLVSATGSGLYVLGSSAVSLVRKESTD